MLDKPVNQKLPVPVRYGTYFLNANMSSRSPFSLPPPPAIHAVDAAAIAVVASAAVVTQKSALPHHAPPPPRIGVGVGRNRSNLRKGTNNERPKGTNNERPKIASTHLVSTDRQRRANNVQPRIPTISSRKVRAKLSLLRFI